MNKNTFSLSKIISIILIFVLSFTLIACGEEEKEIDRTINTDFTDNLKLPYNVSSNSSFINDGIGYVKLNQNVDGDTAHLIDSTGVYFTVRFLMINTPESTGKVDPWGKAASEYTASKLSGAKEIICEAEDASKAATLDTTNKRYLAYVWYRNSETEDFRLLNLEIVEECYSKFTGASTVSNYTDIFNQANDKCQLKQRRVFGESDPNFDYSGEVNEITIAYLRENFDTYSNNGSFLLITARIVRAVGDDVYLEDVDQTWNDTTNEYNTAGIYMYAGYTATLGGYSLGTVLRFQCQCVTNDIYGKQLTNPTKVEKIESEKVDFTIREFDGLETIDLKALEGLVICVKNYTITRISEMKEGSYTIYGKTKSGQEINVRVDSSAFPKLVYADLTANFEAGVTEFNVIGGVSQYSDSYQIMIGNLISKAKNDFSPVNAE